MRICIGILDHITATEKKERDEMRRRTTVKLFGGGGEMTVDSSEGENVRIADTARLSESAKDEERSFLF
jgi:hypothetical protein